MFLIIVFTAILSDVGSDNGLSEVRELFIRASRQHESRALFHSTMTALHNKSAVHLAYHGAAKAMMAEVVYSPYNKYTLFTQGTKLIEQAVLQAPYNEEIRYIRFMIQANCPAFLNYRSNLRDDYRFICDRMPNNDLSLWQQNFKGYILGNRVLQAELERQ